MTIKALTALTKEWMAVAANDYVCEATRRMARREAEKYARMKDSLQRKQALGEIAGEL